MILDTNALSAYLDKTPEAVEIVSEARELAMTRMEEEAEQLCADGVVGRRVCFRYRAVTPPRGVRKVSAANAGSMRRP